MLPTMPTSVHPNAERISHAKWNGGTYVDGVPWRFVMHTVEAMPRSRAGALSVAANHDNPPHLWVWVEGNLIIQTVRLDRSAFALRHPSGTPETNKMRALQAEVFGFAKDMGDKPASFWRFLGERVVRPLRAMGYVIDLGNVAPTTGSNGYGTDGDVRMSRAAWRSFDGVCGHANVPDNSHWDPGDADLAALARYAAPIKPPAPKPPTPKPDTVYTEDNDMRIPAFLCTAKGSSQVWLTDNVTKRKVDNPDYLASLICTGVGVVDPATNKPYVWDADHVNAIDLAT